MDSGDPETKLIYEVIVIVNSVSVAGCVNFVNSNNSTEAKNGRKQEKSDR